MSYFVGAVHHLRVFTYSENKLHTMRFFSTLDEYDEYISIVESIISSFKFIYSSRLDETENSRSQEMIVRNGFIEFSDSILRFKFSYPTSWIKMTRPEEKNLIFFKV